VIFTSKAAPIVLAFRKAGNIVSRYIGKGPKSASVPRGRRSRSEPETLAGRLTRRDYEALSEFRYLLRRFLGFSEQAANAAGLTSRQHQALLAIKGYPEDNVVTIQALAERLCVRHHSAVELVDRLVQGGLVARCTDTRDRRRVLLRLLPLAERRLARLSATHLEELRRLRPALRRILDLVGQPVSDRTVT
jgi:DNA-binding MarR family transcriptional regulator